MTIKTATKIAVIVCLITLVCVPIYAWAFMSRELDGVGGFVAATTGPLGVLIGGMAIRGVSRDRSGNAGE